MKLRYCFLSFLVMGWGYYELSGGADFVPASRAVAGDPGPALSAPPAEDRRGVETRAAAGAAAGDSVAPAGQAARDDAPAPATASPDAALAASEAPQGDAPSPSAPTGAAPEVVTRASTGPLDTLSVTGARPIPPLAGAQAASAPLDGARAVPPGGEIRSLATPGEGPATVITAAGNRVVSLSAPDDAAPDALGGGALREVAGSRVNMRAGPGMGHGVLATLPRGTGAQVIGTSNGWAHVILSESGQEGWIAERLLRPAPG